MGEKMEDEMEAAAEGSGLGILSQYLRMEWQRKRKLHPLTRNPKPYYCICTEIDLILN